MYFPKDKVLGQSGKIVATGPMYSFKVTLLYHPKRDWTFAVRYEYGCYDLSAFILLYSQRILSVVLLAVVV